MRELCNPGASGSIFYITEDDKFIIKTVQRKEAEFLQKLLPGYYMVSWSLAGWLSSLCLINSAAANLEKGPYFRRNHGRTSCKHIFIEGTCIELQKRMVVKSVFRVKPYSILRVTGVMRVQIFFTFFPRCHCNFLNFTNK